MHLRLRRALVGIRGRSGVAEVDSVTRGVENGIEFRSCRCWSERRVAFLGRSLPRMAWVDVNEGEVGGVNGSRTRKSTLTILNIRLEVHRFDVAVVGHSGREAQHGK